MFFTIRLLKYAPPPDKSWRKEMYRRLTWHLYGRKRNCLRLQRMAIKKALQASTAETKPRRRNIYNIFSNRIAAGCAEHGVQYSSFMKSLEEADIKLDRKILASLTIYEPRSFQSLCEFVKQKHSEDLHLGLASAIKPRPSGIITRDMIDKVYD